MTFRFSVGAAAAAFCGLVFAWAAWPPEISWRIEPGSISTRSGHAFVSTIVLPAYLPAALIPGDDLADPERSGLQVFEDGRALGPPHSVHDEISKAGSGRYSHWLASIIFSASDNSDPRSNGRDYQARVRVAPPRFIVVLAAAAALLFAGIGLFRGRRFFPARRTVLRIVAAVGSVAAIGIFAWALFPPQGFWRIAPKDIGPNTGRSYMAVLDKPALAPLASVRGDNADANRGSALRLYEDGKLLGPPHAPHALVSDVGAGLYSHWGEAIVFSSADNSDPRTNGRSYEARAPVEPDGWLLLCATLILLGVLGLGWRRLLQADGARERVLGIAAAVTGVATRRTVLRIVAAVGCAAAIGIFAWALFPPQGVWRIAPKDIGPNTGRSFMAVLDEPALAPYASVRSDNADATKFSDLRLYEDGKLLGPPHAVHALISDIGAGLYSHWENAVIFAASDNSDPRANGRRYEARVPVEPAAWLVLCAAAILLGALGFGWRRLLQARGSPRSERRLRIAAAAPALAFVVAASLATISPLGVFRGEREVSATELSPDLPQAVLDPADRASRNGVYVLEFPRFFAPFLEIDCCSRFEIRRGETPILLDGEFDAEPDNTRMPAERIRVRPDNRFYDFEDYLYLRLEAAPQWHEVFTLRFPIKAEPEPIAALWLSAIGMIILHRRITRFLLQPTPAALLRGAAAVSATLGVTLLVINTIGLFVPLRSGEVDHPSRATITRSYGRGDATLTWEAARTQLAPEPGESRAAYAHRLTNVVAQSVMHYWRERDRRAFRLQVPIWENYILWLAGEVRPEYRLHAFADPFKAIERGTGMCDQVSSALTILLRRQGLDARLVQLNGHTVVTAEVGPGDWHVLDADFNVVIAKSIAQIEAQPDLVRPYYQAAFDRLDAAPVPIDLIASFYAPPTYIGEAGANAVLGEQRIRFEAFAYWLKWRLPLMLLALATLVAIGLSLARSPTGRLPMVRRLFRR